MSDDVEAVAKVLEPFFLFEGDRTEEAVAAIECLRSRGWRHVPDGYVVVPDPAGWEQGKSYSFSLSAVEKEK